MLLLHDKENNVEKKQTTHTHSIGIAKTTTTAAAARQSIAFIHFRIIVRTIAITVAVSYSVIVALSHFMRMHYCAQWQTIFRISTTLFLCLCFEIQKKQKNKNKKQKICVVKLSRLPVKMLLKMHAATKSWFLMQMYGMSVCV